MDLVHPLRTVTPTLDGDVLEVLAGTSRPLTGREIAKLSSGRSPEGVRQVLARLVHQGVVLSESHGSVKLYSLNRSHLAAAYIVGLAGMRDELLARLRDLFSTWAAPPAVAVLFGSAARSDPTPESDLDILLVRRASCTADDDCWRSQVNELQRVATAWTGNDTRVLEYGEDELPLVGDEPVMRSAVAEGLELFGDLKLVNRLGPHA